MPDKTTHSRLASEGAFIKATRVMPGGVSSPVRAFKGVGGTPVFVREGNGCIVKDIDGNSYIDYVASYGPLIAGHAHVRVVAAVSKAIGRGASFGMPTEGETQLAFAIIEAMPSIEMIRFVNSGTEAVMSAIRLARAFTKRELIVKCIGGYHGHSDGLLAEAGSGALTMGTSASPGVPAGVAGLTLLASYNSLSSAKKLFDKHGEKIAAFLVEPVAGNMGVVLPAEGYLRGLRDLCDKQGTLLIFDEVMTGFRVGPGGAQALYQMQPDLTTLGKIIGGGLPIGAYGGKKEIMEMISPSGPVYQAGTLSGNPLATSGGFATLEILKEPGVYPTLEERSAKLAAGLQKAADDAGVPMTVNRVGSMLTPFFVQKKGDVVTNYQQATSCDTVAYAKFFHAMLDNGVMLAPSQYEAMFVGLAHSDEHIERTIQAAGEAMQVPS